MARNSLDVESMTLSIGFCKLTVFVYHEGPAHQLWWSVDPGIFGNIALSSSHKMQAFGTILPFPMLMSGSNFPLLSWAVDAWSSKLSIGPLPLPSGVNETTSIATSALNGVRTIGTSLPSSSSASSVVLGSSFSSCPKGNIRSCPFLSNSRNASAIPNDANSDLTTWWPRFHVVTSETLQTFTPPTQDNGLMWSTFERMSPLPSSITWSFKCLVLRSHSGCSEKMLIHSTAWESW